ELDLRRTLRLQVLLTARRRGIEPAPSVEGGVQVRTPAAVADDRGGVRGDRTVDRRLVPCLAPRRPQLPERQDGVRLQVERLREVPGEARLREIVTLLGRAEGAEPVVPQRTRQEELVEQVQLRL